MNYEVYYDMEKTTEELYNEKVRELYDAIYYDQENKWIEQLWKDIYANAGLTWGEKCTAAQFETAVVDFFTANTKAQKASEVQYAPC